MEHDQLFKSVLTAQLPPFLELFFPDEAWRLDLGRARFVDKELFAAPPMGPGREVDVLAEIPLRAGAAAERSDADSALVAVHIEVQSRRERGFVWRNLEYYALLRRIEEKPVFPIALFPMVNVLAGGLGRRPSAGYEEVLQHDEVLGHGTLHYAFFALTLPVLDAGAYLARPQALAGALAARMRRAAGIPVSRHKLACLRRIIDGSGVDREETRHLLADVVETYLPLTGADADQFEQLLDSPENQGVRETMKTWLEQHEEIGEKRGEKRGAIRQAQEDVLRVLELRFNPLPGDVTTRVKAMDDAAELSALLARAVTASSLSELGLA
jgi:hypothetical protein